MYRTINQQIAAARAALLLVVALPLSTTLVAQTSGAPTGSANYVAPSDSVSGQSMLELLARANREEIRDARAALASTRDAEVRRFGQRMVDDHTIALSRGIALWDRLGYTRADSITTLAPAGPAMRDSPGAVPPPSGGAGPTASPADRDYISHQIAAHQELLTQLKEKERLVTDDQVRGLTADARATVERHLVEARGLQARQQRSAP